MSGDHEVFPVSRASYLDGWWRRFKYQPGRLVDRYVRPGDTVLDIGCGPGLFTLPIARRVGENGQVIAVDLQEGMLEILKEKATLEGLLARIRLRLCRRHQRGMQLPHRRQPVRRAGHGRQCLGVVLGPVCRFVPENAVRQESDRSHKRKPARIAGRGV